MSKVTIRRVEHADGEAERLRVIPGIEIWKVMDNATEKITDIESYHTI